MRCDLNLAWQSFDRITDDGNNSIDDDPYLIFVSDDPTPVFFANYVSNVGLCDTLIQSPS